MNWPELFVGGAIGAILGWVGNEFLKGVAGDSVERMVRHARYMLFPPVDIVEELVRIGNHTTSLFLLDGNGSRKYTTNTISTRFFDGTPDSPDDISDRILAKEKQMEAAREAKNEKVWDGIGVGIRAYTILRDTKEDFLGLSIDFYKSRYAQFQATVAEIGTEDRTDPNSIYQRHLRDKSPTELVPYLARHVGVAVLIVTSDDVLLVARRNKSTGARPGEFDVSVVEGIEPTKDADMSGDVNRIDIFKTVARGCEEEMGFLPAYEEILILGFGVDLRFYQFNFLALVKTHQSYQQIAGNRNGRAKDGWESRIVPIRRRIDPVLELINAENMWGFASLLLYWSLLDASPKQIVEARAMQIVIRRDDYSSP